MSFKYAAGIMPTDRHAATCTKFCTKFELLFIKNDLSGYVDQACRTCTYILSILALTTTIIQCLQP